MTPKTFTQADVDRLISERLTRERGKFADYDDLKAKATELKKLQDAQLTEQQRLDARRSELEQKLSNAESAATQQRMTIQERLIQAEVKTIAAGLGFLDPGDAWRMADLADVTMDDEFQVDGAKVKKALEKLAKDKPYLISGSSKPVTHGTPGRGTTPGAPTQPTAPAAKETFTRF